MSDCPMKEELKREIAELKKEVEGLKDAIQNHKHSVDETVYVPYG